MSPKEALDRISQALAQLAVPLAAHKELQGYVQIILTAITTQEKAPEE